MIELPAHSETARAAEALTPREIVAELDRHVVGQAAAKRAVAIALRNRIRRQRLPPELAAEVMPKNILMIGPTGVGKTEIARRLARITGSPFVKVEASKYTEVGYVGRDVESIIRELVQAGIEMLRREKRAEVQARAERDAEERLLDLLLPAPPPRTPGAAEAGEGGAAPREGARGTREKLREQLRAGRLDERLVEVESRDRSHPPLQILGGQGLEDLDTQLKELLPGLLGGRARRRSVPVREARGILLEQELERLIDVDQLARLAIERVESSGIVFIDELDKIAGREAGRGPDVSREGVQRDLLPIVEGTSVQTRWGSVRTDHVLFVAAGAFHLSKPSDLIPEMQGRFPIRVELQPLSEADLLRILTEPQASLVTQYRALLATEGVDLDFSPAALAELARCAAEINRGSEDIGARRLATILERVLEDVSFSAGESGPRRVRLEPDDVRRALAPLLADRDLARFIL